MNNIAVRAFFILSLFSSPLWAASPPSEPSTKEVALLKPKLNSERIKHFFGSYGVEQLDCCQHLFPNSRISNLYSLENGKKVMRTFAIVDFDFPIPSELMSAHQKIMNGQSIGSTLRDDNWEIVKEPIYFGRIHLPGTAMQWMQAKDSQNGAVHIYQLMVKNTHHSSLIPYCTIIEVHSPQYLTVDWLKELYDSEYKEHHVLNNALKPLFILINECLATLPRPEQF